MLDTLIAWLNPAALVREVLIGLFLAIVGGFAFARAEKEWERLTGYVSHRTRASRARLERQVGFYERNPQYLPLHLGQILNLQFGVVFLGIICLGILVVNTFIESGLKNAEPGAVVLAHIISGVIVFASGIVILISQYFLLQMQAVTNTLLRRATQDNARPADTVQ